MQTLAQRFWSKVDKSGGPNACWLWPSTKGRGKFTFRSNRESAARVAWMLKHGPLRAKICVLHKCDNPRCVNLRHLFAGTKKDNAQDMARKGRQVFQRHPERASRGAQHWTKKHPELVLRGDAHPARLNPEMIRRGQDHWAFGKTRPDVQGENNASAVLSTVQVRQMRVCAGSYREIAGRYGVTKSTVARIKRYEAWRHVA